VREQEITLWVERQVADIRAPECSTIGRFCHTPYPHCVQQAIGGTLYQAVRAITAFRQHWNAKTAGQLHVGLGSRGSIGVARRWTRIAIPEMC